MSLVSVSVRRHLALALALLLIAAVAVISTTQATAAALGGTVSGFVEIHEAGVTSRYAGVEIEIRDAATVVGGPVTTAADGTYSVSAPDDGTYSVVATPPAASGLTPITEPSVVLAAGETVALNLRFEVVDTRVAVTGTVSDGSGAPVAGVDVRISSVGPDAVGDDGGTATTGSDGTYRIDVRSKSSYRISADAGGVGGLPSVYEVTHDGTQDFSSATVVDIQLPRSTVTFRVEDTRAAAVASAFVSIPNTTLTGPSLGTAPTSSIHVASSNVPTNASGSVSILLPSGTLSAVATPGSGSGLLSNGATFSVPAPSTVVIILEDEPDPGKTRVTAHLEHTDGTDLAGAQFLVIAGGQGSADASGNVDFEATTVTDRLQIRGPHAFLPQHLMLTTDDDVALVSGGVLAVGNVVVPTVETKLRVLDPAGNPVAGAVLDFFLAPKVTGLAIGPYPASGTANYQRGYVTSDADGYITMWLLGDASDIYRATVQPPRCGSGVAYDLSSQSASFGAGEVTIVNLLGEKCPLPAPEAVAVDGRLIYHGIGLDGFEFSVRGTVHEDRGRLQDATNDGFFDIESELVPDTYRFISVSGDLTPTVRVNVSTTEPIRTVVEGGPNTWATVSLDGLDDDLVPLRVRVIDPDDQPISGVRVSTRSAPSVTGLAIEGVPATGRSYSSGVTGSDGVTVLSLFSTSEAGGSEASFGAASVSGGTYTLFLGPPAQYQSVTVYSIDLPDGGARITVKLVLAEVDDPPPTPTTTTTTTTTTAPTVPPPPVTTTVPEVTTTTSSSTTTAAPNNDTTTTTTVADETTTSTSGSVVGSNEEELPKTGGPGDLSVLGVVAVLSILLGALAVRASRLNLMAERTGRRSD